MIKLYDKNMNYIQSFASYKELKITEELETGYKIAQFLVPYSVGSIKEEQKVEIDNYIYVIKEVNMGDSEYYEVYCKPYFSGLLNKGIDIYTGYGVIFNEVMDNLLKDTGWSYEGDIIGAYSVALYSKTLLEALKSVSDIYDCFFIYKTKEKKIIAVPKSAGIGAKVAYTLTAANISHCQVQSNTYDLVTRLYPVGKDCTTILKVNDNCMYLENFDYTDEIIVGYYINSHIANADDLLSFGKRKLAEISKPQTSYKIQLSQFNIPIEVGDKIKVFDNIKKLNFTAFVKKIVEFPNEPEQSFIELGSSLISFDDIYKSLREAQDSVNEDTLRNLTELNKYAVNEDRVKALIAANSTKK